MLPTKSTLAKKAGKAPNILATGPHEGCGRFAYLFPWLIKSFLWELKYVKESPTSWDFWRAGKKHTHTQTS